MTVSSSKHSLPHIDFVLRNESFATVFRQCLERLATHEIAFMSITNAESGGDESLK